MKKLLLTLLLLFSLGLAAKAQTTENISEDFKNASWMTITAKASVKDNVTTDKSTVTNISYSYVQAYESKGNGIILIGSSSKKGWVSFSLSENTTKITLKTGANASIAAIVDVYANDVAIKSNLALDKKATDFVIDVPAEYQATGTIYKINNISEKNAQFQSFAYTVVKGGPQNFTFDGFTDRTVDLDDMVELNLPADAPTITYSSTNRDVAYVKENVIYAMGLGSADITATWGESEAWKAGSKTFTITVVNPNLKDAGLSFESATYDAEVGVEFSSARLNNPYNLAVVYSSENPEIATVDAATGVVTPLAAGTVKITAKSEATTEYNAGEASYTLNVVKVNRANSLAEFIAMGKELGDNAEIVINFDMTVTYANAANTYVTDGETFGLIFKNKATENLAEAGQVLKAGWVGKLTVYQEVLPEIIPVSDPTIDGTAEFTPKTYTLAEITDEMVNEVVLIKGVEFATATPGSSAIGTALNFTGTQNGTEGAFYNKFKIASVDAGTYDVIAVVSLFKQNDKTDMVREIYPIEYMPVNKLVDDYVLVETTLHPKAGRVTVEYMFDIENWDGSEPQYDVQVFVNGTNVNATEVKPKATAKAAAENAKAFKGKLVYEAEALKNAAKEDVKVEFKATVGKTVVAGESAPSTTTGIEDVTVEVEGEAEYFNLQGLRVAQPEAGQLYIKRQGGKAVKVRF